jgi:GDP-4-dehydro-6-deoxy-D-mannose reductase
LDALKRHSPGCRVLVAATSDEYGVVEPQYCPIVEDAPLKPVSPYAASKVAQEAVARMFSTAFGLQVITTRAFMHIGPGQPPSFATADWARQIARAEAGLQEPKVTVGNLDLKRELGDVRDVVAAYQVVLEAGVPGEVYNVATGEAPRLGEALSILSDLAEVTVEVVVDPAKIRPADPPLLMGSAAKLNRLTGWTPQHNLESTLGDVLAYWRQEVAREQTRAVGR